MCTDPKDIKKYNEIMSRKYREVTVEEYDFLKQMRYPVEQLKYKVKENVSS
jgi:hypothetical protein